MGLIPWLVFSFGTRVGGSGLLYSAIAALVVSLLVLLDVWRHRPLSLPFNALEVGAPIVFGAFTATALAMGKSASGLNLEARTLAYGILSAMLFASLLSHPLIEQCTRQLVPSDRSKSVRYRAFTNSVTRAWAAAFLAISVSYLVGLALNSPTWRSMFNWLVPLLIVLPTARYSTNRWWDFFDHQSLTKLADTLSLPSLPSELAPHESSQQSFGHRRVAGDIARVTHMPKKRHD